MALQDELRGFITPAIDTPFLLQLLIALALGALIGLERERHRLQGLVLAGIRTFPLVAMSGVVLVKVGELTSAPYVVAVGAGGFALFALLFAYVRHTMQQTGFTSPIALFVTYLIGVLIGLGLVFEGLVAGVVVTALLFTKERLHRLAEVMTKEELSGALQFIVLAFILFPLFQDEAVDRYGILNPKRILLIVVFVAAISFASFLAMRLWGARRGLTVSGVLGGLVNSEAATASLASTAARDPPVQPTAAVAILGANATMLVRNVLIALFVDTSFGLAGRLAAPYAAMLAVTAVPALLWRRSAPPTEHRVEVKNPFSIPAALKFAVVFTLLHAFTVLTIAAEDAGRWSVYASALGGFVSVAAVVASAGTLVAEGRLAVEAAAWIVVLATAFSMVTKLVITRTNSRELEARLRWPLALTAVGGLVALFLVAALT